MKRGRVSECDDVETALRTMDLQDAQKLEAEGGFHKNNDHNGFEIPTAIEGDEDLNDVPSTKMSAHDFDDESSKSDSEDDHGFDPAEIDPEIVKEEFARYICVSQCSPRLTECPHFQRVVFSANPFVQLPDFKTTKVYCLKFYEKERIKIRQIMRNWDGKISLSVEILKTRSDFFLCLKAHFISDNWKQKEWVLGFKTIYPETVPEEILKFLKYFGIEDKIFSITFKNNGFCLDLVEMVKSNIESNKKLEINGQLFHVYSCAALLTSMVKDAFGEISEILDKISDIIPWVKYQEQWIFSNFMIQNALNYHLTTELTSELDDDYNILTAVEWKTIEEINKLVDKVHIVAKLLFEAKYPTASTFLINLHDLRVNLRKYASSSCTFVSASTKKMLQKLDKYWKDMFLLMATAVVMDPRCKMRYVEYLCEKMEGFDDNLQSSSVLEIVQSLYVSYDTSILKQDDSESDSNASDDECENFESEDDNLPTRRRKEVTQGCVDEDNSSLQDYKEFVQATSQPPMSDLDWYLAEPVHPWDQDFNLLKWWRSASPKYPALSRMARDLLAIPFTVLTSFDAYYVEERLVDRQYLSAGSVLMNALMCTRSWCRRK